MDCYLLALQYITRVVHGFLMLSHTMFRLAKVKIASETNLLRAQLCYLGKSKTLIT